MPKVSSEHLTAFGQAVKTARSLRGLTLDQLGFEALGRDNAKAFLSQIEKGKRTIGAVTAGKLISFLDLSTDLLTPFLGDEAQEDFAPEDARAAELVKTAEAEGDTGVGESLLIALAYEYAEGDTTGLDSAYRGLKAALEAARDLAARAALPDNTGDGVAAVRQALQRVNEEEGPEAGGSYLDDAIARQLAETGTLLDMGVKQDRLRNDPAAAAQKLVTKLRLDVDAAGLFDTLRLLRREWYERGRDGGLNFESTIAIHLAEACRDMAQGTVQRGKALNDLGLALWIMGQRESGAARLDAAVATFEAALAELTRDKVPLDWAMVQNNLGLALKDLGGRDSGVARLEAAVAAFEAALEERTRDKVPLKWAMTQNNLGNALWALGSRESGVARLEAAVAAYEAALEERTRDKVPLSWATTQNNLGNALRALGTRESGVARLEAAVAAYQAALEERTRDKVPLSWATTQNNLGNALRALGTRESGVARLEAAVAAYQAALEVRTREKVPLQWAMTQNNLGNALRALGSRESGVARLEAAVAAYEAALEVRTRDKVPLQRALTQGNLCDVELVYFDKTGDAAHLDRAQAYVDAAKAVFVEAQASHYIGMADDLIAKIAERRGG